MPESSTRKKKSSKSAANQSVESSLKDIDSPNPAWFVRLMFGFLIGGLAWIITYYTTGAQWPLGSGFANINAALNLGNWNIAIGFGLVLVGFGMSTRWK
jgi:hypothetical protein